MEEKLINFIADLSTIEEAMYRGIKNNSVTAAFGEKLLELLNKFQKNVVMFRNSQLLNTSTKNDYNSFISNKNMEKDISELLYVFKMQSEDESELSVQTLRLFENTAKNMPILRGIVENLLEEYMERHKDDEIFKPENINKNEILTYLDNAITELEKNTKIDDFTKKNILIYINEIKNELKQNTPTWRKIVGGFVIVAAIISGMADADTAYNNINKAYNSIIGKDFSSVYEQKTIYKIDSTVIDMLDFKKVDIKNTLQLEGKVDNETPTIG